MGYSVFLNNPVTGIGPGAIKFAMPAQRPNFATALGLKQFNDDPHSAVVSLLAETGIIGLFAIATLVIYLLGIGIRKRSKELFYEELHETETVTPASNIYWLPAVIPIALSALLFKVGIINLAILFFSIPTGVVFAGLTNCLYHQQSLASNRHLLSKTPMIAVAAFVFHSTFNNNLTVAPLLSTLTVVAGLLLSSSLKDVGWKKRFSFSGILFLFLPLAYSFAAYNLQASYQQEQLMLFSGARLLEKGEAVKSQKKFENAIKSNPQSLHAYLGLAISLKKQNQLDEAQNVFEKLNSMVANVFNTNYELARLLFERKHFLEAHRYALKSLAWNLTPGNYELLGKILLSEGKTEEARKIFKEGLVFIPDHKRSERLAADRIRLHLAAIAANSSNYELCEQYLKQITSFIRKSSDALYLRGLVLSQKDEHEKALDLFERALIESPNNPRIMNAVGFILVKKEQNLERAQKLLETAYHLIKNSETPMLSDLLMVAHSLGILYWKQGQLNQAEKLLEIAWSQSPPLWKDLKEKRFNDLKEFLRQNNRTDSLQRLNQANQTDQPSNSGY
jgi:tetratricopeptide (TPR) repeat protein